MIKIKKFTKVGIAGFGGYLPYWRLKVEQIAKAWGQEADIKKSLGIEQKAVASRDEDCVTMAVEAGRTSLQRSGIKPKKIGAVFVGSESHPYSVKPSAVIVADILGIGPEYFCVDLEFACKAGTAGMQITAGLIESGLIEYGLVIASDKAQARPGDALEFTAGAGAAAFLLGPKEESLTDLISTYSYNSDTPDFWRRQGCSYPSHTGRFTAEPGYFHHLESAVKNFLKRIKKKPVDFAFAVFHMPNLKFPIKAGKRLGFTDKQMGLGLLVPRIGNPYSASSLLGLIAVLEKAKPSQNILLASYGSGAGSDVFWLKTKKSLSKTKKDSLLENQINNYEQINYVQYLQKTEILK